MQTKQDLIIGKDYGFAFGYDKAQVIYQGGDAWQAVDPVKGSKAMDSPKVTAAVLAYLNRPAVHTAPNYS